MNFSGRAGATGFGVVYRATVGNAAPRGQFVMPDKRDSQTKITSAYRSTAKRSAVGKWSWNARNARPGRVTVTKGVQNT